MIVRKVVDVTCIYKSGEERTKDINDKITKGYKCVSEGAASFDLSKIKSTEFKSGDLYLYAKFEKVEV